MKRKNKQKTQKGTSDKKNKEKIAQANCNIPKRWLNVNISRPQTKNVNRLVLI